MLRKRNTKKLLLCGIMALVVTFTNFMPAFAYKMPTINEHGQSWETESNDDEKNATLLIRTINGELADIADTDCYVYHSTVTKKSTLLLGYSSNLNLPDAKVYLYIAEKFNGNYTPIHAGEVSASKISRITFDAVKGHTYVIMVGINGGNPEIQDRIDFLKERTGRGHTYLLNIS